MNEQPQESINAFLSRYKALRRELRRARPRMQRVGHHGSVEQLEKELSRHEQCLASAMRALNLGSPLKAGNSMRSYANEMVGTVLSVHEEEVVIHVAEKRYRGFTVPGRTVPAHTVTARFSEDIGMWFDDDNDDEWFPAAQTSSSGEELETSTPSQLCP